VDLVHRIVHIAPMFRSRSLAAFLRIAAVVVFVWASMPWSIDARSRQPRDKPLSRATRLAVEEARALAERAAEDWQSLESRYDAGQITVADLEQLRIYWATADTIRFARSTWTLDLLRDELDSPTAVRLPVAVLSGDFAVVDEVLTAYVAATTEPRAELLLLQTAALWGLGREGGAALVYRDALAADSVLTYYDTAIEEWLRGRVQDISEDREEVFAPADLTRAEALRQELMERGAAGRLLMAFLRGTPLPEEGFHPPADLDDGVVAELFDTRREALYFCFEKAGGEARLGSGAVVVDMDVDSMGRVGFCAVQPASALKDRDLWDCSCDVATSLHFPCPHEVGKATVRHRIEFPIGN